MPNVAVVRGSNGLDHEVEFTNLISSGPVRVCRLCFAMERLLTTFTGIACVATSTSTPQPGGATLTGQGLSGAPAPQQTASRLNGHSLVLKADPRAGTSWLECTACGLKGGSPTAVARLGQCAGSAQQLPLPLGLTGAPLPVTSAAPVAPTKQTARNRCTQCNVEMSAYLDAWHGDPDSPYKQQCNRCRPRGV